MSSSHIDFVGTIGNPVPTEGYPVAGKDVNGDLTFLKVSAAGLVGVLGHSTLEAAARGLDSRFTHVLMHASYQETGTTRALLSKGGHTSPGVNGQRSFQSSSANDTSAGTGVRKIRLRYLDSTRGTIKTETVTMNGTTAVNTAATDIAYIFDIFASEVGSGGNADGTITMYDAIDAGGSAMATMEPGEIDWQTAHLHMPTDKRLYITRISVSTNGGNNGKVDILHGVKINGTDIIPASYKIRVPGGGSVGANDFYEFIVTDPGGDFEVFVEPGSPNQEWVFNAEGFMEDA